jgi:Protein of unknown function (DUF2934)
MGQTSCDVSTEEIARRAYEIWESRGRPSGDGSADWDAAIAELNSQRRSTGGLRHWWERMRRSIAGRDS